ncbi:GNAT family N-acetyltransferase [Primorskyibacter sp. 2E107]|uniref:GNAT family N-acetyltransferase n=1 Tax=Primorskyibacter sp. 2E107 TaxID=3403458 RepID=UPI003AF4B3F8
MSRIVRIESADPSVEAILAAHYQAMAEATPAESCHVMTSEALRASGARVYAMASDGGGFCAVGALKPIGGGAVELKSMHVLADARGRGHGRSLLRHLIEEARRDGMDVAYLETGSEAGFASARALYESAGFDYCAPFADYVPDPLSVFMVRKL